MTHRAVADIRLRHLLHGDCCLHTHIAADPLQGVGQRQRVHRGGQACRYGLRGCGPCCRCCGLSRSCAADHNGNLGSQVIDLFDAGADGLQRAVIQAGFLVACKRFSAELDKHTLIHKFSLPIFFLPGPFDPRFYYLLFYRKVGHDVKPLFFFFPVCSNPAALFCEKRGEAKGQKKRVQASPCTLPQKAAPALILPCWQLRLQSRRPFSPGLRPSRNVRRRRSQSCRPALWLWLRCKI